jgi:tRNA(Ile2) C34 agmatinyltransferase TiaS
MTAVTETSTVEMLTAETEPGICWECRGPCLTYKGSQHGWRCRACCTRYVAAGAALAAKVETKEREKRLAKFRGSGLALGRTANITPLPIASPKGHPP